MTDNETRDIRHQAAWVHSQSPQRYKDFLTGWNSALASIPIPADTAALITETRGTLSSATGFVHLRGLSMRLADALESSSREVECLRMALKEKERP